MQIVLCGLRTPNPTEAPVLPDGIRNPHRPGIRLCDGRTPMKIPSRSDLFDLRVADYTDCGPILESPCA